MKVGKIRYFTILFLIISAPLFSQYLEEGDIQIYVNNKEKIENFIVDFVFFNEKEELTYMDDDWKKYIETVSEISYYSSESFTQQFQNILNCKVPSELEEFFRNIGWPNNGHKKLFTISTIFAIVIKINKSDMYDNQYYVLTEILYSFNEFDVEIINENIDLLVFLFMGLL